LAQAIIHVTNPQVSASLGSINLKKFASKVFLKYSAPITSFEAGGTTMNSALAGRGHCFLLVIEKMTSTMTSINPKSTTSIKMPIPALIVEPVLQAASYTLKS